MGLDATVDRVSGERLAWPVWDKLEDGSWVPDLHRHLHREALHAGAGPSGADDLLTARRR